MLFIYKLTDVQHHICAFGFLGVSHANPLPACMPICRWCIGEEDRFIRLLVPLLLVPLLLLCRGDLIKLICRGDLMYVCLFVRTYWYARDIA